MNNKSLYELRIKALMAYEIANFREWDYKKALWRFHNHPDTNQAVNQIVSVLLGDTLCAECEGFGDVPSVGVTPIEETQPCKKCSGTGRVKQCT